MLLFQGRSPETTGTKRVPGWRIGGPSARGLWEIAKYPPRTKLMRCRPLDDFASAPQRSAPQRSVPTDTPHLHNANLHTTMNLHITCMSVTAMLPLSTVTMSASQTMTPPPFFVFFSKAPLSAQEVCTLAAACAEAVSQREAVKAYKPISQPKHQPLAPTSTGGLAPPPLYKRSAKSTQGMTPTPLPTPPCAHLTPEAAPPALPTQVG